MDIQPEDWAKPFIGMREWELVALVPPPGLDGAATDAWYRDRDRALASLRAQMTWPNKKDDRSAADAAPALADQIANLDAMLSRVAEEREEAEQAAKPLPAEPLAVPKGGVAELLEHQIGTCAALIDNIARFVAGGESRPDVCFPFMDRISAMLASSAQAAKVVGQLRGIPTETRQTFVKEGAGAGGVPQI